MFSFVFLYEEIFVFLLLLLLLFLLLLLLFVCVCFFLKSFYLFTCVLLYFFKGVIYALPLIFWLCLVLAGLAVSDVGLSLFQSWVPVLLGDQFCLGGICLWRAVASAVGSIRKPDVSCPCLFLGSHVLMAPDRSILCQEFEQKWWSYLCS